MRAINADRLLNVFDSIAWDSKRDRANAINQVRQAPTIKRRWIPVSEKLPETNKEVLITHRDGMSIAYYNGEHWIRNYISKNRPMKTVKAWMPLPKEYF